MTATIDRSKPMSRCTEPEIVIVDATEPTVPGRTDRIEQTDPDPVEAEIRLGL